MSAFKDFVFINLINCYGGHIAKCLGWIWYFYPYCYCYFQREPIHICIHLFPSPLCKQSIRGVEGNGDGHSRHGAALLWLSSFLFLIFPSFFWEEEILQAVNVFLLHFMTLIYGNSSRNGWGCSMDYKMNWPFCELVLLRSFSQADNKNFSKSEKSLYRNRIPNVTGF